MRVVNATQLLEGRNLIHEGIFKGILMYPRFTSVFTDEKHFFHPFLSRVTSVIKHAARPPCNYTIILS